MFVAKMDIGMRIVTFLIALWLKERQHHQSNRDPVGFVRKCTKDEQRKIFPIIEIEEVYKRSEFD